MGVVTSRLTGGVAALLGLELMEFRCTAVSEPVLCPVVNTGAVSFKGCVRCTGSMEDVTVIEFVKEFGAYRPRVTRTVPTEGIEYPPGTHVMMMYAARLAGSPIDSRWPGHARS